MMFVTMFSTWHLRRSWDLLKWMLVITLAGAFALWLAGTAKGTEPQTPPRRLEKDLITEARPLPWLPAKPVNAEQVWSVLELHYGAQPKAAIAQWQTMPLSGSTDLWRHIAMGSAYLETGQQLAALRALRSAEAMDPDNALLAFFTARLRLQQAEHASDWPDAIGPTDIRRMVAYLPLEVAPNSRSMYELAAMQAFEKALRLAPKLRLEQPLASPFQLLASGSGPNVRDLLTALGVDDYVAVAHDELGRLCLKHAQLDRANEHIDAASSAGIDQSQAYRRLASEYLDQGRTTDAARAMSRSVTGFEGEQQENEPAPRTT